MIRGSTLAGLLALGVAGGSDPGDDLPPALAERHQRAVSGDTAAQLDLGLRYVTGKGLAPDERAALRCIGNAAERGEHDARGLAPGVQSDLSDADREQARQRAQQYRRGPL